MGGRTVKKPLLFSVLLLGACTRTVYQDRPVEVKVPVTVPCVKDKPVEVKPLRDQMTRQQWDALSLDQREKLLLGQGMDRKAFGDKAMVVVAGCPE